MRAVVIVLCVALAGCVDVASPDDLRSEAVGRVQALLADVPCDVPVDASTGGSTSENLVPLHFAPFAEGTASEIDIAGDLVVVGRKSAGGFEVYNTTDPMAPKLLSAVYHPDGFSSRDVKFTPDDQGLVVATGGQTFDFYDLRDPAAPVLTDTYPMPTEFGRLRDAHMIWTHHIAGEDWLFMATLSNEGVWIYRLTGGPEDRGMEFVTQTSEVQGGPLGVHDMWITHDESADAMWLYAADGFMGWTVWNIDDPASPVFVTAVPNADPFQGYVHTVQAEWIDGRRIVATIAEVGHDALKVYDATDIVAPKLLATWQQDPIMDGTTPQHNLQLVDGRLYVAHYTRGVFVFDLRDLPTIPLSGVGGGTLPGAALEPIARFATDVTPGTGPNAWDEFWDVVLVEGILYTADYHGLHTVAFSCIAPGDPLHTSRG